jgi:hypothetical protein
MTKQMSSRRIVDRRPVQRQSRRAVPTIPINASRARDDLMAKRERSPPLKPKTA